MPRLLVENLSGEAAQQIDKAWAWLRHCFPRTVGGRRTRVSEPDDHVLEDVMGYTGPEVIRGLREFRAAWANHYGAGMFTPPDSRGHYRGKLRLDADSARVMRALIRLRLESALLTFDSISESVREELCQTQNILSSYIAKCLATRAAYDNASAVDALAELGRQ